MQSRPESNANPLESGASVSPFFEASRLTGLESMRFSTQRRVEGSYSGRHVAKQRGGAGEFVDYREYSPGDDLRRLDWKAMGRTGRSYLKLYQDETDLRCTLFLDASGSMTQGVRRNSNGVSKLAWMQYFATAFSHLLLLGRDSAGLAIINDQFFDYLAPVASFQQRGLLHQKIASLNAQGGTDLAHGFDQLLLQAKKRGVIVVLSDFLVSSIDPTLAGVRKLRSRGWEVITIHLVHPDEERLPQGNAFRFEGLESDGVVDCHVHEIRAAYEERFQSHLRETRAALQSVGCDYHLVRTNTDYLEVLRDFLVLRSAAT